MSMLLIERLSSRCAAFALLLSVFSPCATVHSAPVERAVAESVALNFAANHFGSAVKLAAGGSADTAGCAWYAVNFEPSGFVIVSADDAAIPVLGYSRDGAFDASAVPPQLRAVLSGYESQIGNLRSRGVSAGADAALAWKTLTDKQPEKKDPGMMAPMLDGLAWGQGAGWSAQCPKDPEAPGGNVCAGSVATAMSQIMRYYRWPEAGVGTHAYTDPVYGPQSVDYGASAYNWAAMAPNAPSDEAAKLIYHAGVAVNTQYGRGDSTAFAGDVPQAMREHFRYRSGEVQLRADGETSVTWGAKIVAELAASRPVFYAAKNSDSRWQAFVVDGYDGPLFHVNWGLNGYYNGYFLLDSLLPGNGDSFTLESLFIPGLAPQQTQSQSTVTFVANGGQGPMASQGFSSDAEQPLSTNVFIRSNYRFIGWNTAVNGSGKSYADCERVVVLSDMVLYAQWEECSPDKGWLSISSNPDTALGCGGTVTFSNGKAPCCFGGGVSTICCPVGSSYTVTFRDVSGWSTPAPTQGTMTGADSVSVVGTYSALPADYGVLRVMIQPTKACLAGAQWSIDNGATWCSNGQVCLPSGLYTITFKDIPEWVEPAAESVELAPGETLTVVTNYTTDKTFDLNCVGGDFSAGTLAPGARLDFQWFVNATQQFGTQFWCEAFASRTGGFDLERFGCTVTQSHVQTGLKSPVNKLNPGNQILNPLPDGRYTLVPFVNHPARQISTTEDNSTDNWAPIAGKRLSVRNTAGANVDLVLQNTVVTPVGVCGVDISAQVVNAGTSPMTGPGCWVEAFYGYLNAEGDCVPQGCVGPGQLVSGLAPGTSMSVRLLGTVPPGVHTRALYVIADSTDIVHESNKVNNTYLTYRPELLPKGKPNGVDLQITAMTVSRYQLAPTYQVAPGDMLEYSVTVKNNGITLTDPVWLELFGSRDGCMSRVRGASVTESPMLIMPPAGESRTYNLSQKINSIGDGMYSVMAIVNRDGLAGNPGDMTPTDNCFKFTGGRLSMVTPHNDNNVNLTWQGAPVFSYDQETGWMTVTGTVVNTGSSTCRSFWIEPFIGYLENQTGIFVNERPLAGGTYCAGLAPGATQYVSTTGYVGKGKVVGILIDGTDLVAETDETDNYDYSELTY